VRRRRSLKKESTAIGVGGYTQKRGARPKERTQRMAIKKSGEIQLVYFCKKRKISHHDAEPNRKTINERAKGWGWEDHAGGREVGDSGFPETKKDIAKRRRSSGIWSTVWVISRNTGGGERFISAQKKDMQ